MTAPPPDRHAQRPRGKRTFRFLPCILDRVNSCRVRPTENRHPPNLRRARQCRCATGAQGIARHAMGSFRRRGTSAGAIAEPGAAAERGGPRGTQRRGNSGGHSRCRHAACFSADPGSRAAPNFRRRSRFLAGSARSSPALDSNAKFRNRRWRSTRSLRSAGRTHDWSFLNCWMITEFKDRR